MINIKRTSPHKAVKPRGSNPTSPADLPSKAGCCSKNGTDLDLTFSAVDDLIWVDGANPNTSERRETTRKLLNILKIS